MKETKTVLYTQNGAYCIRKREGAEWLYRGENGTGTSASFRVVGAIDALPQNGLLAEATGEYTVLSKGIEDHIRSQARRREVRPLRHAVVENDERKLMILPLTRGIESRETKVRRRLEEVVNA